MAKDLSPGARRRILLLFRESGFAATTVCPERSGRVGISVLNLFFT